MSDPLPSRDRLALSLLSWRNPGVDRQPLVMPVSSARLFLPSGGNKYYDCLTRCIDLEDSLALAFI